MSVEWSNVFTVQSTYKLRQSVARKVAYTINLYHTTCTLLVNGRSWRNFRDYDWLKIFNMLDSANSELLNNNLKDILSELCSSILHQSKNSSTMHKRGFHQCSNSTQKIPPLAGEVIDVTVESITCDAIVDCPSVALKDKTVTSSHAVDVTVDTIVVPDAIVDCPSVTVTEKTVALRVVDCVTDVNDIHDTAFAKVVIEENAIDITSSLISSDIAGFLGSNIDCAAADVSNMTDEVPYVSDGTDVSVIDCIIFKAVILLPLMCCPVCWVKILMLTTFCHCCSWRLKKILLT